MVRIEIEGNDAYYDHASVEVIDDFTGTRKKKENIDLYNLLQAFIEARAGQLDYQWIGELPSNYVDGSIFRKSNNIICAKVLTLIPKGKRVFQHIETTFPEMNVPALLFYWVIENNRIYKTSVYALKEPVFNNKTTLYQYPYGNVYSSGDVCWGTIDRPEINMLKKLDIAETVFLRSITSNDLYSESYTTQKEKSLRDLLWYVNGFEEFPDEILVKSDVTAEGLIKKVREVYDYE